MDFPSSALYTLISRIMASTYHGQYYVHAPVVAQQSRRRASSQGNLSPTTNVRPKNHVRFQPAEGEDVVLSTRRPSNTSQRSANSVRPVNAEGLGATALHRSTSTLVNPDQRREKAHAIYGTPQGYKVVMLPPHQQHPGYDPTQAYSSPRYRTYHPQKFATKKPSRNLLGSLVHNLKATAKKYGCHSPSTSEMSQVSSAPMNAPTTLSPQMTRHYGFYQLTTNDEEEQARTRRQLSQWRDATLQSHVPAPYQFVYPQPVPILSSNYGAFGPVQPQRRDSNLYYITTR